MHLSHITLVLALACLVPERADAEIVLQTENRAFSAIPPCTQGGHRGVLRYTQS